MISLNNYFESRIGFWREFGIGLALALAARASMIFPLNYSQDTYRFLNYPEAVNFPLFASEMRGLTYPVTLFLESIGAFYPYAGAFWLILFSAALVFAGLISMRIWVPEAGSLILIIGSSLVALFPYQSDYLSFHNAAPLFTLTLILGWLAFYFCTQSRRAFLLCVPVMVYALSGQVLFGFLFLVVFFETVIWAFRRCLDRPISPKAACVSAIPWATRMLILFLSALVYVVIGKLTLSVTGITPSSRLEFSTLADYPDKFLLYLKMSYFFLFKGEVSLPWLVKIFQLSIFVIIVVAGFSKILGIQKWRFSRLVIWVAVMGLILMAVGACMGVLLPIKNAYVFMCPRTLSALSMYWAGVFAVACCFSSGWLRGILALLGAILALSYAANSNRQAVDFARINERERLVASRMVDRMTLLPESGKIRTVVLVGATNKFLTDRITTETAGFNISSLYRPWSDTAVLREVSGIPFEYPTEQDRELAKRAAVGKPDWPAQGSVFIDGDVGIVVIPK